MAQLTRVKLDCIYHIYGVRAADPSNDRDSALRLVIGVAEIEVGIYARLRRAVAGGPDHIS